MNLIILLCTILFLPQGNSDDNINAYLWDKYRFDYYCVKVVNNSTNTIFVLRCYSDMTFLDSTILEPSVTRAGLNRTFLGNTFETFRMLPVRSGAAYFDNIKKNFYRHREGRYYKYFIRVYDMDYADYIRDSLGGYDHPSKFIRFEWRHSKLIEAKRVTEAELENAKF